LIENAAEDLLHRWRDVGLQDGHPRGLVLADGNFLF
jgi:hypothetical protein